ncbi:MAG: hypothetical protein PHE43_00165 [Candidatus Nanoarchaeia archaeon]|nr:hypothetical protein [Candidatus Nanoarchaeia archaeon]
MIQLLGVLDMIAALALFLTKFDKLEIMAWIAAGYLIIKALLFFGDFGSIVDGICGIIVIFGIFGVFGIVSYLAIAWLVTKGLISLVS